MRRIRRAESDADRLAGLAVRHAAFRRTMPVAAYQAARLASPMERRATPWVVERGGRVVGTLLCHPLAFGLDDVDVPGYGLGSVAVLPSHQGRGHATALCAAVCEEAEHAGREVGLLFASVRPAFYERIGFVVSPAWSHRCIRLREFAESGPEAALTPLDPAREAERLARDWEAHLRGALHLRRDAATVLRSATDEPTEWWFAARSGYVRVADGAGSLEVLEAMVPPEAETPVLRAVARLALSQGRPALSGWLEPTETVRAWFEPESREATLPMLRRAPGHALARFFGSDHF